MDLKDDQQLYKEILPENTPRLLIFSQFNNFEVSAPI